MPNRRWTCPRCDRPGVLAPGRMRKDDVRRYCLPCSKDTGRLVARTCPALDTKRERAKVKRREKAKADIAKRGERWRLADGTDVVNLLWRARRLPAWRRQSESAARAVRRCEVDILIGKPSGNHGRAWGSRRVHVHLRKRAHPAEAMALIVHELAHVADYVCRGSNKRHHDRFFWTLWLDAMQCVYPALREREAELWANRDALIAENRALDRENGERFYSQHNHYALENANSKLLREVHAAAAS